MTDTERLAIREALRTADFSRSPGLRDRLQRSLRPHYNWGLLGVIAACLAFWTLVLWWLL